MSIIENEIKWRGEPSEDYYYYVNTALTSESGEGKINRFMTENFEEAKAVFEERHETYPDGEIRIRKISKDYFKRVFIRSWINEESIKLDMWFVVEE